MKPPRYLVQYEPKDSPDSPGWASVIDTQSTGEWGEPLRVLLVAPACTAQAEADRFNAAHQRDQTETDS
jgi:hypothetical protein